MNPLVGMLGAAALFVLFAVASRLGRAGGCGGCHEPEGSADCGACPIDPELRESSDAT